MSLILKYSDTKLIYIVDQHLEGACCAPAWIRHWLPAGEFSFPKQYCTLFVWGDLDREQISVFDLNSDEINRSVHYVHHKIF